MNKITPVEIVVGMIVLILVLSMSILLNPLMKDGLINELKTYQQSVKIVNSYQFDYAIKTEVGNILAYGSLKAVDKATMPEIKGEYAILKRVTERYSRHTRQVCNSRDKKGNCTSYRTEVYYTWDTAGAVVAEAKQYEFLGVLFQSDKLEVDTIYRLDLNGDTVTDGYVSKVYWNYIYDSNFYFNSVGDLRHYFVMTPTEVNASIFLRSFNGAVTNPMNSEAKLKVYYNTTTEVVVQSKVDGLNRFDVIFYTLITVLTIVIYGIVAYEKLDIR